MPQNYIEDIIYMVFGLTFYFVSYVVFIGMYQKAVVTAIPIIGSETNMTHPIETEWGRKIDHVNTMEVFAPLEMYYSSTIPEYNYPHYL